MTSVTNISLFYLTFEMNIDALVNQYFSKFVPAVSAKYLFTSEGKLL